MSARAHAMFLPVSGPVGTGEYMRCRIIAEAAQARWSDLRVSFALSRQAPYLDTVPFETHRLDRSPTFETPRVCELLRRERPDVVVFDNAGRTAQLECARAVGARTVFISRRAGKRRKAFRLRWLRLLDSHWIAFPPFIDGPLSALERLKLRLAPHLEALFLGSVFTTSTPARRDELLERLGLRGERYVLFTAGGGGRAGNGDATVETFAAAARRVAAATRTRAVVVLGQSFTGTVPAAAGVRTIPVLPNAALMDLMHDAHVVVVNGGTTLMQALAMRRVCVAVPVASDQHRRVERCRRLGLAAAAPLDSAAIADAAVDLLTDPVRHWAVTTRVAGEALENGLPRAVAALSRLLGRAGEGR